ncbi:hypothetical protein CROQUDRAFT_135425 [Cronartium quercuum f. sp. fusiforme G11]|uniref:Amino-acid acetyltransferase, mitochondrial n=1 Tax=Cronartium quercuum f. sp. fusiforme G11 TaxID=708437 RepID=A0A9P6NB30_9BASI|nr:hypothetical protein CROQUDRAFT_135425 [Cronartium quercuum f. sp. fusiforme G11]
MVPSPISIIGRRKPTGHSNVLRNRTVLSSSLGQPSSYHRPITRSVEPEDDGRASADKFHRDLILSVLQAHPSVRDSRLYLKSFAPPLSSPPKRESACQAGPSNPSPPSASQLDANAGPSSSSSGTYLAPFPTWESMPTTATVVSPNEFSSTQARQADATLTAAVTAPVSVLESILSVPHQHTGLVKIQGPFTDRQLGSIIDGIIYLKTLGLVPIIVVDDERWQTNTSLSYSSPHWRESLRSHISHETTRLANMIEARGGETRPMPTDLFRLGDGRGPGGDGPDVWVESVTGLRSAVAHSEIPVLSPVAINSSCAAVCITADEALKALAAGLAAASVDHQANWAAIDLTPLRLMIINREGGIPSPARNGHPHLSINLASEYEFIHQTFRWTASHPTSLANLKLARACLAKLPNEASALIVSHRSPKSLIANLITNKPAHSPSLRHATLLNSHHDVGPATPTLIRKGLPIRVLREFGSVDQDKMTQLLEASFRRRLGAQAFYGRLARTMKFVIVAGDYQGVAVVTDEWVNEEVREGDEPVAYLDKFAVLPSLQGEGIVDFLWGALRDESFGLGCPDALNNNGGLGGQGKAMDLVWRSRMENPVNKWYWERSSGHHKLGPSFGSKIPFSLFWCLADHGAHQAPNDRRGSGGASLAPSYDRSGVKEGSDPICSTRLKDWVTVVSKIPSCWV